MSYRVTLGLLVVLAVLAGAVYYVESKPATPTPSATGAAVLNLLASEVTQLEVAGEAATVVVARDGEGPWLLKQPEEAPADQFRVDGLVSRLATLAATRSIESPASLAEFGLEKPAAQAKLTLKSGETPTVLLGDRTPDKTSYYAKLPTGPTVYLIPVSVGGDLTRLLEDPPKATPTPTPVDPAPLPATPSPASGTPTPAP